MKGPTEMNKKTVSRSPRRGARTVTSVKERKGGEAKTDE